METRWQQTGCVVGEACFVAGRKMAAEDSGSGEEKGMTRNGGAAEETAADSGVGKVAADGLRVRNAALVVGGCAVRELQFN